MKLIINNDRLEIDMSKAINSGSINYYNIECEFNEAWEGLTKEIILRKTDEEEGFKRTVVNGVANIDYKISGMYQIGVKGYLVRYSKTTDTEIKPEKTYYTRTEEEGLYIYQKVEEPKIEDIDLYYEAEKTLQISTGMKRIPVNLGAGEIEVNEEEIPSPSEMEIFIHQVVEAVERVVPTGGTTGQVLKKKTNSDYDTEWADETGAEVNVLEGIKVQGVEQTISNKEVDLDVATTEDLDSTINWKTEQSTLGGDISVTDALGYKTRDVEVDGAYRQETTTGKNLLSNIFSEYNITDGTYGYKKLIENFTKTYLTVNLIDNDISVDMSGISFGFTNNGKSFDDGGLWIMDNGSLTPNYQYTNQHKYFSFFPKTQEAFNKIFQRFKIQIELNNSTTATPYEPYTGGIPSPNPEYPQEIEVIDEVSIKVNNTTYPIDLQGNKICALPDGTKDELIVDKEGNVSIVKNVGKVILDGSEYWRLSGLGTNNQYLLVVNNLSGYQRQTLDIISSIFTNQYTGAEAYQMNNVYNIATWDNPTENHIRINLPIDVINRDVEQFKVWLSSHNADVYYKLVISQTIPLGKLPNKITTSLGNNTIEAITNLDTTFSITYASKATGGSGNVDDVKVDGVSVVSNKVANINLTGKQDKTDNSLQTTSKQVVGAINELKSDKVGFEDYSSGNTAGVLKVAESIGTSVNNNGNLIASVRTYPQYLSGYDTTIIGKGTLENVITGKQLLSANDVKNNVTSTDTNKPLSANMGKELQDQINNLKSRGRFLSSWNATTGLAMTVPTVNPYEYRTGDYFLIEVVGTTNYKPNGTTYDKDVPSTTVETNVIAQGDVYIYDGTYWILQKNTQIELSFSQITGSPFDNSNLASTLNNKLNTSKVKNTMSTTSGDVYDVTYINSMIGDIETLLGGI